MRIAGLAALLAFAAHAQDRPETVIRTTTRLVQIRVMAEDSHGDPVIDLRKDEIQLLDNRKPRPIDFLTFEGGGQATGAAGAAASPSADIRNDYAVIVLDWLNPGAAERPRLRDSVNQLLHDYRPRQQVALYVLGRQSRLLHDFTSDPAELVAALAATADDPEDPLSPSRPPETDGRYKTWVTLNVEERIFGFNNRIIDTIEALGKLADGLGRIPGRKSMLWVSNGFPIRLDRRAVPGSAGEIADYGPFAEPLIDKLNRTNVALYTVDPRGFAPSSYGDVDTLQELSLRTGATAFAGRNDLAEGMRLALEDSATGYTLGFTLASDAAPGVHEIQLKTTRAGVRLRYRESYQFSDGR